MCPGGTSVSAANTDHDRAGHGDLSPRREPAARAQLRTRVPELLVGLAASVLTDLPSSAVIVWAMAVLAILLHLAARPQYPVDLEEG